MVGLGSSMIGSTSSSTSLNVDTDSITSNGKKPLKEGSVQMTSLTTLLSFHRYFFLYHDTLIVSKQKGACSYKLKEKVRLSELWTASANTPDSFLIGWPLVNYLVHFRTRDEKDEWFEMFICCVQQNLKPVFTTISMDINVRGRKQVIRRRVENGKKSGELVVETATDLGLPNTSYELRLSVGENSSKTLQGPENVYAVILSEIVRSGIRLSESQRQSLDTCPIANARLILSNMKSTRTPTPMQIVNSIKKRVLQRNDSRGFIGKDLDGPTPPQPIMTIVDHLRMKGYDSEGIFRKSPKQSTFKELRGELERGLVPDFNKYSTHVLASMLKEYLRGIPGKILQSSNYDLWMKEVVDEIDPEKQVSAASNLIRLLPSSHAILLANVLKLLNKVAASPESKMSASALSVCLAPSFLESTDPMEGGKKIPLLVEFLIENAADVVPGFNSDNIFSVLHPVDMNQNIVCSPTCSDDASSQRTPIIEELCDDTLSTSSLADSAWSQHEQTTNTVPEAPLTFSSDSEDDDSGLGRFGRSNSDLRKSDDTLERPKINPMPDPPKERKETPRSPCLKRIHFQRQAEAQHRSSELFKYDSRTEFKFASRKSSVEKGPDDLPPSRKESREEATQTAECGLPALQDGQKVPEPVTTILAPRHVYQRSDEKPTVHVPPFSTQAEVEERIETSLHSISERLKALRERSKEERIESPKMIRKIGGHLPPPSPSPLDRFEGVSMRNRTSPANILNRYSVIETSPKNRPKLITEKFSPYCIEPDYGLEKRPELQRTASQRSEKSVHDGPKELQRACSVKARRGERGCVGMEPLEINWSVRHLKTLFQDTRAPSIDTEYPCPF